MFIAAILSDAFRSARHSGQNITGIIYRKRFLLSVDGKRARHKLALDFQESGSTTVTKSGRRQPVSMEKPHQETVPPPCGGDG